MDYLSLSFWTIFLAVLVIAEQQRKRRIRRWFQHRICTRLWAGFTQPDTEWVLWGGK